MAAEILSIRSLNNKKNFKDNHLTAASFTKTEGYEANMKQKIVVSLLTGVWPGDTGERGSVAVI